MKNVDEIYIAYLKQIRDVLNIMAAKLLENHPLGSQLFSNYMDGCMALDDDVKKFIKEGENDVNKSTSED